MKKNILIGTLIVGVWIGFLNEQINNNLELKLSEKKFSVCADETKKKIDKYVVSQFNYLGEKTDSGFGKYGYVADISDCYNLDNIVIRKIENEHFYLRQLNRWQNISGPSRNLKQRIFKPQMTDGLVTSDLGFDINAFFKKR